MSKTERTPKRSLQERIALARELGCDVIEFPGGNGEIGAVYGRVSGPEQAVDSVWGLKRQRGMAGKAEGLNYSAVISILSDMIGVSGALGPEDRPGFRRLCELIELGIADDVFVLEFSRLVRERVIGLEFATLCIRNQATIIDETGRVLDPSDEVGLILYVIELMKSEGERNRINSRLQGSRRVKASEGRNPGFNIPTGYYTDPTLEKSDPDYDRFKIYVPHIALPTFVLSEVLRTGRHAPKEILKACREKGLSLLPPFEPEMLRRHMETRSSLFKSPRDGSGNYIVLPTLVRSIVHNHRWYAGVFEWGKNSEWGPPLRIEDNHPAIITHAQSLEIERILARQRRGPCERQGILPLAGLVWSFNSDGKAVPLEYAMTTGYAPRYICSWDYNRSVPGSSTWSLTHHLVEEPVCAIVLERLVLPDYADQIVAELETNRQQALDAAKRYREWREHLEEEIENLQANFARVNHPDDVASIQRQLDQRREKLARLAIEEESSILGREMMSERDIATYREFLADLPSLWANADNGLRNRFLSIVLEGVYILKGPNHFDARIVWYNGQEEFIRVHIPPRYREGSEWTEEDLQYLREHFATASWEEMLTRLRRKEIAIRLQAFKLGLKRREEHIYPRKRWSEEEEQVLRRYSRGEMSFRQMTELLPGRNEEAIYSRMKYKGLPQPTHPYWHYLPESYASSFPSWD